MAVIVDIAAHPDAVAKLLAKTPVTSPLRSAAWEGMPLALRERAQWSAGLESVRAAAMLQSKLLARVSMVKEQLANGKSAWVDRSSFIGDMRQAMIAEGLSDGTSQAVTDIASRKRLGLIFDMQTQSAGEYAGWKAGQSAGALDAVPAQELVRIADREEPRDWMSRWTGAGGDLPSGRMVALKNDPIWSAISRFGTPWPPFDYNSGMGVEDVSREDAEALGLLGPDDTVEPMQKDFNAGLEASVADLPPESVAGLKNAFGDQVQILDGKAQWQGNLIGDLYQKATTQKDFKQEIALGTATPKAIQEAAKAGINLEGWTMNMSADEIRKAWKDHGTDAARERARGQEPISKLDFEMLPAIWRDPDKVSLGEPKTLTDGTVVERRLVFEKTLLGLTRSVEWVRSENKMRLGLKTLYRWAK